MYINLHKLKHLHFGDIEILVALKQKETGLLIEYMTDDHLERFRNLGYLDEVKTKKGEHIYASLRASKKLKDFLIECSYEGAADEESEKLANWIINVYKSKSGGIVKNKLEIKRRIHWFKTITGISGNRLAILMSCFIQDTYNEKDGESVKEFMDRNKRGVLSNMCDVICWNPPNHFARHYTLADSPLYRYYEDNTEYIEKVWESKGI